VLHFVFPLNERLDGSARSLTLNPCRLGSVPGTGRHGGFVAAGIERMRKGGRPQRAAMVLAKSTKTRLIKLRDYNLESNRLLAQRGFCQCVAHKFTFDPGKIVFRGESELSCDLFSSLFFMVSTIRAIFITLFLVFWEILSGINLNSRAKL